MAMLGVGIVLLLTTYRDSYAEAGAVAAASVAAGSLMAPLQARLADRYGQPKVLAPLLLAHTAALTAVVLAVVSGRPLLVIGAAAAASGASLPQFDSFVRVRWANHLEGTGRLPTAFAWESVLDEVIFVVGPVVVTLVATIISPVLAVLGTLAFTLTGGLAYLACRSTVPPTHTRLAGERREPLVWRTLVPLVVAFTGLGVAFGAVEVTTVGFTDQAGQPAAAGLVLAAFAAGSLVAGLVFGAVVTGPPTRVRLVVAQVGLTAALALTWLAETPLVLAGALAIAGVTISPSLITGFGLAEHTAARSRVTESLAWTITALGIGVAIGAAVVGPIIDTRGAADAFVVPVVGALVAVLAASLLPGSGARALAPAVHAERSV
jgi:MFS family permease